MTNTEVLMEKQLAEVLSVQEEQLPITLQEIGEELLFHFATDPEIFKMFSNSKQKKLDLEKAEKVKEFLHNKNISSILKEKLISK